MDGVNASALGLMPAVTIILSFEAFSDYLTPAITLASLLTMFRAKSKPSWLIAEVGLLVWISSLLQ
jgi:hypothetical protein